MVDKNNAEFLQSGIRHRFAGLPPDRTINNTGLDFGGKSDFLEYATLIRHQAVSRDAPLYRQRLRYLERQPGCCFYN